MKTPPSAPRPKSPYGSTSTWVLSFGLALAVSIVMLWFVTPHKLMRTARAPVVVPAKTNVVKLTREQAGDVNVGPVELRTFVQQRAAVGIIDVDREHAVDVASPYAGRIGQVLVVAGDDVKQGQVLYTVQAPDFAQAAATLISAAGNLKTASETLRRAQQLVTTQSISQREFQQNASEQQTAEANYRAARKTMGAFGLADREIDAVEAKRRVDLEMPVRSPIAGRVTARAAAPGMLVQPGGAAPISVANLGQLWMVASVPEADIAAYKLGNAVTVTVAAYPERTFTGKVSYIGDTSDPQTHRIPVRAVIADPQHLLKPQMMANFTITIGKTDNAVGVPQNAVTREADGSMSAWVTTNGTDFQRRTVKTGLIVDGYVEITEGLAAGEKIARDRAIFLSNLNATKN